MSCQLRKMGGLVITLVIRKWVCIVIQVSTHINILKAKTAVQIRGEKQLKAEWPEGTLSCVISKTIHIKREKHLE